jgi:hypothetical protein
MPAINNDIYIYNGNVPGRRTTQMPASLAASYSGCNARKPSKSITPRDGLINPIWVYTLTAFKPAALTFWRMSGHRDGTGNLKVWNSPELIAKLVSQNQEINGGINTYYKNILWPRNIRLYLSNCTWSVRLNFCTSTVASGIFASAGRTFEDVLARKTVDDIWFKEKEGAQESLSRNLEDINAKQLAMTQIMIQNQPDLRFSRYWFSKPKTREELASFERGEQLWLGRPKRWSVFCWPRFVGSVREISEQVSSLDSITERSKVGLALRTGSKGVTMEDAQQSSTFNV